MGEKCFPNNSEKFMVYCPKNLDFSPNSAFGTIPRNNLKNQGKVGYA